MRQSSAPATTTTDRIFFELDRFERASEDRLELSGRWYGIRGRRFVRPTLTLVSGEQTVRALADLEHKPWAAEEGEDWQAAFPCEAVDVAEAQLAVAPDIAVKLPALGTNGSSPRRLDAVPNRKPARRAKSGRSRPEAKPAEAKPGAKRPKAEPRQAAAAASRPKPAPPPPAPAPELKAELEETRGAMSKLGEELAQARQELDQARAALERTEGERDEVKAAFEKRNALVKELRQALSEREEGDRESSQAQQQREQELAKREAALTQREAALGDRNRVLDQRETALSRQGNELSERESKLGKREQALTKQASELSDRERLVGEREQALAQRPVLARGAAPAVRPDSPMPGRRSEVAVWIQRGFAVVFLIVPIVAVLVLTKTL